MYTAIKLKECYGIKESDLFLSMKAVGRPVESSYYDAVCLGIE